MHRQGGVAEWRLRGRAGSESKGRKGVRKMNVPDSPPHQEENCFITLGRGVTSHDTRSRIVGPRKARVADRR